MATEEDILFRGFPVRERDHFLAMGHERQCQPMAPVIRDQTAGASLFIVLEGKGSIWKGDILLDTIGEGDVFGEIALIKDIPTTATVIAGKDGEFLFLSRKEFEDRVRRNPELWRTLSEISEERLKETTRLMSETEFLGDDEFILI